MIGFARTTETDKGPDEWAFLGVGGFFGLVSLSAANFALGSNSLLFGGVSLLSSR